LQSHFGTAFTFVPLCHFIYLLLHLEEQLVEQAGRLGNHSLLAVAFVLLEHLVHRLELTVLDEGGESYVHVVHIEARALRMNVGQVDANLIDPEVPKERLELLLVSHARLLLLGDLGFGCRTLLMEAQLLAAFVLFRVVTQIVDHRDKF